MEEVESDRGHLYVRDGFIFKCNKIVNGIRYVKCKFEGCGSRASFTNDNIISMSAHNHDADEVHLEMLRLKADLKRMAEQDPERGPRDVFNDVCRRFIMGQKFKAYDSEPGHTTGPIYTQVVPNERFPRAAPLLGFPSVRSTLYRHRQQGMPPVPHSLEEFAETLQEERWADLTKVMGEGEEPFFKGLVGGEAVGWSAVVYISPRLQNALGQTTRLHMDATFKVVPVQLHAYQLLTIHAEYMNNLFPVVFALMNRKTQEAYEGVFSFVKRNIPRWEPEFVLADFEPAMRNAAQQVWPAAQLVGCFFHYAQAIFRMHERFHMGNLTQDNPEANVALRLLMSLALLPSNLISVGLDVVKYYVRQHNLEDQFQDLMGYMDDYWVHVVGTQNFSVFGQSHRTNNAVENFYRQLKRTMGEHPGVWDFHKKLRMIEGDQWVDYCRASNNVRHVRPRRREYARQDAAIFEASTLLTQGRYNVAQFLKKVSYCTDTLLEILRGGRRRRPAMVDGEPENARAAADPVMPPQYQVPAGVAVPLEIAFHEAPAEEAALIPLHPGLDAPEVAVEEERPQDLLHVVVQQPARGPVRRRRRGPQRPQPREGPNPPAQAVANAAAQPDRPADLRDENVAPEGPAHPAEHPPVVPRQPGTCTICIAQPAAMAAIPCGHICVCEDCAAILQERREDDRCPLCRSDIIGFFLVFHDL